MAERFRHFVAIDWSGAAGERHKGIAVAVADAGGGPPVLVDHIWSRGDILGVLRDLPDRALVGLDLGIALPFVDCGAYFPGWDESPSDARRLWGLVDAICRNDAHHGVRPFVDHARASDFFRRHGAREGALFRCDGAAHGRGRLRVTELEQARMGCHPTSNFNLVGASQVGKSSLSGMRVLNALGGAVPVWPIDPVPAFGSVIVEIYTTIAAMAAGRSAGRAKARSYEELNQALAGLGTGPVAATGPIDDHSADALMTAAWLRLAAHDAALWHPAAMTPAIARTEGWTFGVP